MGIAPGVYSHVIYSLGVRVVKLTLPLFCGDESIVDTLHQ